ncbi:hypothetical protein DSECCO2_313000 [anaerobic digester metagenome]
MTLVSTSRKAAPGIRALARGLAFALEGRYMARGKTGLRELVTLDRTLSLFILETDGLRLRIFQDGEPGPSYRVTAHEERVRAGSFDRRLLAAGWVRDQLPPGLDAGQLDDGWDLGYDGPQRLQYRLRLVPEGGAAGDDT